MGFRLFALAWAALAACVPVTALAANLTGTVSYPQMINMMLPPETQLEIVLEDVSLADAPATVIATTTLTNLGGAPYDFELQYDAARIVGNRSYNLRAQAALKGQLLMTSTAAHPVLTRGAPKDGVQVWMDRVTTKASVASPSKDTHTAVGLTLPATFTGALPMASGPGQDWHLDLWPDQVYHLRQTGPDGSSVDDIGRWSADPERGAIVLRGGREAPVFLQLRGNGTLRFMTSDGRPIDSDLPYDLTRSELQITPVSLPMRGMFRYMADAGVFAECITERSYPLYMTEDSLALERAYLETNPEGAPRLITIDGSLDLRPSMEGPDQVHLIVDRFIRVQRDESCERNIATAELTNTYWRLLEITGVELSARPEGTREAHIIIRGGDEPGYSATVGCNQMNGGLTVKGNTLSFGPGAMTMMACPPPLDTQEQALGQALAATATYSINGQTLELFDAEGARLAMLEAAYLP